MKVRALLLLLVLPTLRDAEACDCGIGATDKSLLDQSAAIFVGRVGRDVSPAKTNEAFEVEVLATWRGVDAGAVVTVKTEASDCGFHLATGSTLLFFTNQKFEARQCTTDQDVRFATAKSLAFLGAPKAEVSDKALAACPCSAVAPSKNRKPEFEFRAGKPVPDGRYAVSIPITTIRRPADRLKDAPLPTSILSPAGGCELHLPKTFSFADPTFGETAFANRCVADQLRVR